MSLIEQTQQPADILTTLGLDDNGRRRSWTRRIVYGLIVLALIAAAGLGLRSRQKAEGVTSYITGPAAVGDLVETVSATGTLKALDTVEVGSETSGRILDVLVDFNDRVEKGQVLATIDPEQATALSEEAAARLRAARASVTRAQATVDESNQSLARLRGLRDAGLISDQDFDAAQATARRAEADVASARAQATVAEASLSEARSNLQKTAIRSPIEGIVLSRAVEPGQTVAASFQTPVLFTIARDLSDMALHVQVDEADVGKVREGQTATFRVDAYPGREFASQVVSLRNMATAAENVVTYEAVLAVDNAELLLRPGMTATASVVTERKENVLLVPNAALRFTPPEVATAQQEQRSGLFLPGISQRGPRGERRQQPGAKAATIWVLRQGQPVSVPVTPGATDGRNTEIRSAQLKAGDEVIVDVTAQEEKS
jgi:HlyD family secretion protein